MPDLVTPPQIPIRLRFDDHVTAVVRSRIEYAFRVFAAIYNYRVVNDVVDGGAREFVYGGPPPVDGAAQRYLRIPARYALSLADHRKAAMRKVRYAGEELCVFHGLDAVTRQPDWLGEIFEWLSGKQENDIKTRDSIGRIPDVETIVGRLGLPSWKPQAALQMAWLENAFRNGPCGKEALPKAPSLVPDADHFVICTHDVDFYRTNTRDALMRLLKNVTISLLLYRDASYFVDNARMLIALLTGKPVGAYLPDLISRLEKEGCTSTFFVVPVHGHRRDPTYRISDLLLSPAARNSFAVELHASYTSLLEKGTLRPEARALANVTGVWPRGNRQHWLRFGDQQSLFDAIEDAELLFDSSVGFTETVGFRNGACFAFPPYNFKEEKAYPFLEFPLAIMDGGLLEISRASGEPPQSLADRVLTESRKRGWGGISVLWHNPLESLSVPESINRVFWTSLEGRHKLREKWVSSDEFLTLALPRYQSAGLLTCLPKPTYDGAEPLFPVADKNRALNRAFKAAKSLV